MPRRLSLRLALFLTILPHLSACDGNPLPAVSDVNFADFGPLPSVNDMNAPPVDTDSGRELAGFQELCQSNGDCLSGWCVPFEDRSVCTVTCLRREGCPDGWDCRIIDNTPPDVVSACLPPVNRLCGVCERDVDCPGGHCFRLDNESICGLDCDDESPCPDEFSCEEIDGRATCVPTTNSCSCNRSQDGSVRICERINDSGACIGRETCDRVQGWTGCTATEPGPEVCNQVDDDCNGFTDDILGLGEVCEREAEVSGATIACSGRLICTLDSLEPVCTATEPTEELCNFLDDDCDGTTDEGFEGRGDVCIVGQGVCQSVGVNDCSVDGSDYQCSVEPGQPVDELCDGLDNDCDGTADEAFPGLNSICFAGMGACRTAGALRCSEDALQAVCTARPREPVAETCNGIDDDCDGRDDEGFEDLFGQCSDGLGACRRLGFFACGDDGMTVVCSAQAAEPALEVCNGLDDDCDETTDEGFANVNTACSVGIGACRRTGVSQCGEDGASVECGVQAGEPSDETCNGLDDDCDDSIDEAFEDLNGACSVGVGSCRVFGVTECNDDGDDVICDVEPALPGMETCNELDDDCDGDTDEDYPTVNTACRVGVGVCARSGVQRCAADGNGVECSAIVGDPAEESCNGLDDDCDGQVDEIFVGIGDSCSAGAGACLRRGVQACSEDGSSLRCTASAGAPSPELCNGIDDNCDGTVDEGYDDLNTVCTVGTGACLRAGIRICTPDGETTVCSQMPGEPRVEICNGFDDDCDGFNDETHPQLGQICETGTGLCRRSGVYVCGADAAGPVTCDAVAAAPADLDRCDYQDDDCDGAVDESFTDANGRYAQTEHCGACGSDCSTLWAPVPADFGVVPRCAVVGGVAQCAFDCLPGTFDADGLAQNGCELRPDTEAVYVTTPQNGGLDNDNCGPFEQPCASIGRGLLRVTVLNRLRVLVAEGVYRESFSMVNGVDVLGGHQRTTWSRDPALFPTVVSGTGGEGVHRMTIEARGINVPATLDGFVIQGESPLFEGNAYGVYVVDSGPELQISNNHILAANGGQGRDGANGTSGQPGTDGTNGRPGFARVLPGDCQDQVINLGGNGGNAVCGAAIASGGNGGGATCPQIERQEGSGQRGEPAAPGGSGGSGAWGFQAPDAGRCYVSEGGPGDATPGGDGSAGSDGNGGQGAGQGDQGLGNPGAHWTGLSGATGAAATPGGGGGGGGSAAGVNASSWSVFSDIGSSGGGGGSGGCEGLPGEGGASGGGSFGIYISFSGAGPRGVRNFPQLAGNIITRGLGGRGGDGGNGGGGGEGGGGGDGGARGAGLVMEFCAYLGGEGGTGGRGGHAGGGGGGGGGISFDIFVANSNRHNPGYRAANEFGIEDGEITGGQGGSGGNSSNTDIGPGSPAQSGRSGQVGLFR